MRRTRLWRFYDECCGMYILLIEGRQRDLLVVEQDFHEKVAESKFTAGSGTAETSLCIVTMRVRLASAELCVRTFAGASRSMPLHVDRSGVLCPTRSTFCRQRSTSTRTCVSVQGLAVKAEPNSVVL
jgi:hypothetical protein